MSKRPKCTQREHGLILFWLRLIVMVKSLVLVESCFSHVEPGKIWITTKLLWMAWCDARGNESVIEVARVD